MRRISSLCACLALLGILWGGGCAKPAAGPAPAPAKSAVIGGDKDKANLAEFDLPEADRKLAEKQKTCPVTGEPLGSMGKPYKITVKGRTFFLCCEGCKEEIESHPDKYLEKLLK